MQRSCETLLSILVACSAILKDYFGEEVRITEAGKTRFRAV